MKQFFLLITLVCISFQSYSQWRWATRSYFGTQAGVSWAGAVPVPLLDGVSSCFEGAATISDSTTGNLLFYVGNQNVYTSTHVTMPNGTGILAGWSSSQGYVIIPMPSNGNRFYIFTTGDFCNVNGLRYSIVDMTLNAGLGDVMAASKNVALIGTVTEHLAAVKHANCRDYWVVARSCNSNIFRAYLVTASGVSGPVNTNIGVTDTGGWQSGFLKFSPDGTKAAIIHTSPAAIELYDFNNSTGVFSNLVTLSTGGSLYGGLEFSPNSQVLYVGRAANGGDIYQYNLAAGTPAAIIASATFLGNISGGGYTGEVQRGLDNKIYFSPTHGATSLSVINNPNTLGVGCGLVVAGLGLGGRTTQYSLQNLPASFTVPIPGCVTLLHNDIHLEAALLESNDKIALKWHLLEENRSNRFILQRSQDEKNWEDLHETESKNGNAQIDNYEFTDKDPYSGKNFYRVKRLLKDGNTVFSPVKFVETSYLSSKSEISYVYYQNNALNVNCLSDHAQPLTVKIYDVSGKMLKSQEFSLQQGENKFNLPFEAQTGMYIVLMQSKHGQITHKITIY
jgi:hypothetical protein